MEPWDGPAAIAFTDGRIIGATLDRNGLRPGRYMVTEDDLVVLASEAGVLDVPPERVKKKGRLQPGNMFLVDTVAGPHGHRQGNQAGSGCAVSRMASGSRRSRSPSTQLPEPTRVHASDQRRCGVANVHSATADEDLKMVLDPMGSKGEEPIGSMGTDTPLACLSDRPQLLFNYFSSSSRR